MALVAHVALVALLPGRAVHRSVRPCYPRAATLCATDSMASQIGAWIRSDDMQAALSAQDAEDSEEWETEDWDEIPVNVVQVVVEASESAAAAPAAVPRRAVAPPTSPGRATDGDAPVGSIEQGLGSQIEAWVRSDGMQAALSAQPARRDDNDDAGWGEAEDWDDISVDEIDLGSGRDPPGDARGPASASGGGAPPAVPLAVPGRTAPAHARPLAEADEAPFVARALREVRALAPEILLPPLPPPSPSHRLTSFTPNLLQLILGARPRCGRGAAAL